MWKHFWKGFEPILVCSQLRPFMSASVFVVSRSPGWRPGSVSCCRDRQYKFQALCDTWYTPAMSIRRELGGIASLSESPRVFPPESVSWPRLAFMHYELCNYIPQLYPTTLTVQPTPPLRIRTGTPARAFELAYSTGPPARLMGGYCTSYLLIPAFRDHFSERPCLIPTSRTPLDNFTMSYLSDSLLKFILDLNDVLCLQRRGPRPRGFLT